MTIVEFLRRVQLIPPWDREPAICDEDLADLFNQLGEKFAMTVNDPFISGTCYKCIYYFKHPKLSDICCVNSMANKVGSCNTIHICNHYVNKS